MILKGWRFISEDQIPKTLTRSEQILKCRRKGMMSKFIAYLSLLMLLSTAGFAYETLTKEQVRNRVKVRNYAAKYKVDADFCDAIAKIESDYQTNAFNNPKKPMTKEGWISRGVMQLTIATAKKFNKKILSRDDLYNPDRNIIAGIQFIKYLFEKYRDLSYQEIAQIYNLGEKKYHEGMRNEAYVKKFEIAFYELKTKEVIISLYFSNQDFRFALLSLK
jgi:soluble lytic murein transglycosylase-like protein